MKRGTRSSSRAQRLVVAVALAAVAVTLVAGARLALACDTWVALPDAVRDGVTMLGKNSDRVVFDSGPLMFYPHRTWAGGSEIDLGRLAVPQAPETYATLGSSPYWCWGYEEGINEYGVAIGNQGIATKILAEEIAAARAGNGPKEGPTGMDLVRLGLERGKTAREALEVITRLVEAYGQFGPGLPTLGLEGAYDNSFMIADGTEAWILETAGTRWVARRISRGTASISNAFTIGTAWDAASGDITRYAVARGWWPQDSIAVFDFARAYGDETGLGAERVKGARVRGFRSGELARQRSGEIDTGWMMRIARDQATEPSIDLDVTASSCVAVLPQASGEIPVFWWCPTRPSNSCYVPFFVDADRLPAIVSAAGTYGKRVTPPDKAKPDSFSADSYWWLARDLCNLTNAAWDTRHPVVRSEFDGLEKAFEAELPAVVAQATQLKSEGRAAEAARVLGDFTVRCLDQVIEKINNLRERFTVEVAEVPEAFKPFVGSYTGNFGPFKEAVFKVVVQNGRLAVDIPSQAVVELKEPDAGGLRHLVVTDAVAFAFDIAPTGEATAMRLFQTTEMTRRPDDDAAAPAPDEVPEAFRPYVGAYLLPAGLGEAAILVQNGNLALRTRNQEILELQPPATEGWRAFAADSNAAVAFDTDQAGKVTKLRLRQAFTLPKAP